MTRNFYRNSDIDRLYLQRKNGGRALKCIRTTFKARIVAARRRLVSQGNKSIHLACVINHEENKLVRVGREVLESKISMETGNQAFLVEHMSEKC